MRVLWKDAESGIRVVQLTEAVEVEALVRLFESVAETEGWQPEGALRLWTGRSVYFALQEEGRLIGGLQLVRTDLRGTLPCQALWPEVPVASSSRSAHVAILAMDEAYRGRSGLFWTLAVEMWRYCVGKGISTLFIEVTPRVLPLYRRLGWPLMVRGELRRHWGEDCCLCTLGIPEVAEALLRRAECSKYYHRIVVQAFRVSIRANEERRAAVSEKVLSAARFSEYL